MQKADLNRFMEQINDIIDRSNGKTMDAASAIYHTIVKEQNRCSAFRCFLEITHDTDDTEDEEISGETEIQGVFHKEQVELLRRKCEHLTEGILDKIISKNLEPGDFYSELWKKGIEENAILETEEEKIYTLYRIWIDGRIPYFKLEEGIRMDGARFAEIVKAKEEDLKKMIFIFNSYFSQRTERSSQFIKILDSCRTEEEKSVIMAQILSFTEQYGRFQERLEATQKR